MSSTTAAPTRTPLSPWFPRGVTLQDLEQGSLYPPLQRVREVSAHIAQAVAEVASEQGHAAIARPADLLAHVRACMYDPSCPQYA